MKLIRRFRLQSVEDAFTLVSSFAILFILFMTTANVIGRYLFKLPVLGSIEIAAVLLVFIAYLNISAVQRFNLHIGLDGLLELTKRRFPAVYKGLQLFNLSLFLVLMGLVIVYFIPFMLESIKLFLTTRGPLFLPWWPFQLIITLGCFLVCFRLGINIYELLSLSSTRRAATAETLSLSGIISRPCPATPRCARPKAGSAGKDSHPSLVIPHHRMAGRGLNLL